MYAGEDIDVKNWAQLTSEGGAWKVIAELLKANLWEVLAIIGVVQMVILPVIAASTRVRTIAWIALAGHPSLDLTLVQFLVRLWQAQLDGRPLGIERQVGLGRGLLRRDRLGDPDASGNDRLRHHGQPHALEGDRSHIGLRRTA